MLLNLLLSMASVSWAQNQQLPITSLQDPQAQQVVQNALNTKFSVYGGTVTGISNLSTTTVTELCFPDGTCETTTGGAGFPFWKLNGTNIYNTNAGAVGIGINPPTGPSGTLEIGGGPPGMIVDTGQLQLGNIATSSVTLNNNGGNNFSIFFATATQGVGSGGSAVSVGLHLNGAVGRLGFDLQRPQNYPSSAGAAEYTVTETTTSATATEGLSWTSQGYRQGIDFYQETGGGGPSDSIGLAIADHNNLGNARLYNGQRGTDVESITITGFDPSAAGQGPFGSVCIGCYAQWANESAVSTAPYTALQIRTPDFGTASTGFADSHNLALVGTSYDGANYRRFIWDQHVQVLAPGGGSNWILRSQNEAFTTVTDPVVGVSTFVWVTDTGRMAVGSGASTPQKTLDVQGTFQASGNSNFSISITTQAAGGAGAFVTATCASGFYTLTGGCNCTGSIADTTAISIPTCAGTQCAAGAIMPTGWGCQIAGTTGGACAVTVVCSKITNQ